MEAKALISIRSFLKSSVIEKDFYKVFRKHDVLYLQIIYTCKAWQTDAIQ